MLNEAAVVEALKTVKYPGYSRDIVSFGLVKHIAANEGAVARFLDGTLPFAGIPRAIGAALERHADHPATDLPALLAADAAARALVQEFH